MVIFMSEILHDLLDGNKFLNGSALLIIILSLGIVAFTHGSVWWDSIFLALPVFDLRLKHGNLLFSGVDDQRSTLRLLFVILDHLFVEPHFLQFLIPMIPGKMSHGHQLIVVICVPREADTKILGIEFCLDVFDVKVRVTGVFNNSVWLLVVDIEENVLVTHLR